ncbi:F5/8 type C domain protein [Clostridium argentinense CDC 2741]|uniref:F5/8 type C domain protein n=1 Tax=Clostridium argentinense CDC 2741 TaxID=1418104 RepID=A0A0C1U1R8_9CLOT|nr:discoidin domain-containing protein [Clostridium argentinense]ARC85629.1 hypothetical protein RSJ17_14505 [Clostridium argentinense]KIE46869.1 F5/8 type C domain protein [Clostridium argentinense CDC 2741]NFF40850.1 discoidin domain-containing protein [Clostridium argentinense]NFP50782.1 discoidin domain-containing protein [Clostridium argentinense]NFP73061.1 discoidin domain-containing protein [Clostridium argentinense]
MANYKSIIPKMTGYTDKETGITVSGSGKDSPTYPVWGAFDGKESSNYTASYSVNDDKWIKIDFRKKYMIRKYEIFSPWGAGNYEPNDFNLEGSNDDAKWDVLHEVRNNTLKEAWLRYEIENRKSYRFYRLNVLKTRDKSRLSIGEIKLYIDLDIPQIKTLFLLQDNEGKHYTVKSEFYDKDNEKFIPIEEIGNKILLTKEDYHKYGFDDVELITKDMTIDEDIFKPIDKLKGKFKLRIWEDKQI